MQLLWLPSLSLSVINWTDSSSISTWLRNSFSQPEESQLTFNLEVIFVLKGCSGSMQEQVLPRELLNRGVNPFLIINVEEVPPIHLAWQQSLLLFQVRLPLTQSGGVWLDPSQSRSGLSELMSFSGLVLSSGLPSSGSCWPTTSPTPSLLSVSFPLIPTRHSNSRHHWSLSLPRSVHWSRRHSSRLGSADSLQSTKPSGLPLRPGPQTRSREQSQTIRRETSRTKGKHERARCSQFKRSAFFLPSNWRFTQRQHFSRFRELATPKLTQSAWAI